ncbi:putative RNA methyltransferase [Azotobacter chroococcum]|jgi:23S rRNA (guanine745-N1)-methyltransferase|uniref:23S rRNA m(1)G-745 methyltransferase n=1 Tax=Azotobacter chroococcum TaxID=353 RepID=A0A4R1PQI8_9GAMM|nr:methyltransferase domain-containing protein [Azotobacter chroococcum]TBV92564.1 methyltransferase domain-containing protein [Azotobacter chroococcum]TCL33142.1 23S rRNA m(1)G-745 methyltransferase [Azotobacter chroococcum]
MLTCPLCNGALSADERGVTCPAGHRFDRARQGYLNLLPVQHKKSRDPGDNQAMVEARRRFLDGGHYAPLARRLTELAAERAPRRWLDIGCGEGYYTAQLAEALPEADGYALDISREAVKRACRRAPQLTWLVASMARVPLADASCGLLASVFSPLDWQEARRLLAPGGGLLRMGPTREHLLELRGLLYDEVREYDDAKHLSLIPPGMHLAHSETLSYRLRLDNAEDRADLLAMTPHGWRANAERRAAVIAAPLEVTIAIRYDWIERN